MTEFQKQNISEMRSKGCAYSAIAQSLGISVNTIKSYCLRNKPSLKENCCKCDYCGSPLKQMPGRKKKRFCNDICRTNWWNAHPKTESRICPGCGCLFNANGKQKFCSHDCYIKARFYLEPRMVGTVC